MSKTAKLEDIMHYTFYDENGQYVVKLNTDYLKEIFKADIIILEEKY